MTVGVLETAGERLLLESELRWVGELLAEGSAGQLAPALPRENPSLYVVVERSQQPFPASRARLLARGVHADERDVVRENACSSGFDLLLRRREDRAELTYRWRPPPRERVLARALRGRFHLLARAVLMQYPALWWAGLRGRVPLHASGWVCGGVRALVVAAGGVGRSTLLLRELAAGASMTGDNLAVADGTRLWGLVEPLRVAGGDGRRMYHGRREITAGKPLRSLEPECIVMLERAGGVGPALVPSDAVAAARLLATSTYMAGELRRYWGFAATLALATGSGSAHPPVADVAAAFASHLPCFLFGLGREDGPGLSDALTREEVLAWA